LVDKTLAPIWAGGAHLQPSPFRQMLFGEAFDPGVAWGLQRMVRSLIQARTAADLKDTGLQLSDSMMAIGLHKWLGFLKDAEARVAQLQAQSAPTKPGAPAAVSPAAPQSGPRPDGSKPRVNSVA
jgi:hypothetical protein